MDYDPAIMKNMRASQSAHFWSPSASAQVNGELTTFDFENELSGLVIPTEAALALYRSLGEQLGSALTGVR